RDRFQGRSRRPRPRGGRRSGRAAAWGRRALSRHCPLGPGRRRGSRGRGRMSAGDIGRLRARHGHRDGADLIKALRDEYGEKFAVISSFGIESAVLLDLVASVDKAIPVIFLDTNELFDETHAYVAKLTE